MGSRSVIAQNDLPEAAFTRQVIDYACLRGWLCSHFHDSRRQVTRRGKVVWIGDAAAIGYPDLTLARAPRVVLAELKSHKGRLRPSQHRWLETLRACPGVETFLWRPEDWTEIQRVLR